MKIIFLADIVGNPGRKAVKALLPKLILDESPDLVIANTENAAGGFGLDVGTADELFAAGIQVFTTGNHIWDRKEIYPYLETNRGRIVRPANYPAGAPGVGSLLHTTSSGVKVGVANLIGRVFMGESLDCPFRAFDAIHEQWEQEGVKVRFVDIHAEATSEKEAFGFYCDGRASIVVGSHTHVQTADEKILPKGTAYHTDAGRCGVHTSVLGFAPEGAIDRFLTGRPTRLEVVKGLSMVNGTIVEIEPTTGVATSIRRLNLIEPG